MQTANRNLIFTLIVALSTIILFACSYQRNKPGFNALNSGFEVVKINDDESVVIKLKSGETKTLQKEQLDYPFVESVLLKPYCASCHAGAAPSGQHSFSTFAQAMKFVTPQAPEQSRLYMSVKDGSMPKSGPKPKELELQAVAIWIKYGAREKAGEAGQSKTLPKLEELSFAGVTKALLEKDCNSCHQHSDFKTYETLIAKPGRIVPGDPENSSLFARIADGSMPKPHGFTDEEYKTAALDALGAWIRAGAPKEAGGPPVETPKPDEDLKVSRNAYNCLNEKVFATHCNGCHKNFRSYDKFIANYSAELDLRSPKNGNLYHKMAETHTKGERMPPKGFPDEATKKAALQAVEDCLAP